MKPIESFYVTVLHGLPGWMYSFSIPYFLHQSSKSLEVNSGPLSVIIVLGLALFLKMRSSLRIIHLDDSDVSISIASATLEQSSITLKVLNFLISIRLSVLKSILQLLLIYSCCISGWYTLAGSLRLSLRFLFSFRSLYTLFTFLWFQSLPNILR